MAGRVMDQACRLFTRGFYEALLTNGSIGYSAAEGRRTGIRHGTNPRTSVDWAFPALFIAEGIESERLKVSDQAAEQKWQSVANEYATPEYPAFCGRLELFQHLSFLMAGATAQRALTRRDTDLQILALPVKQTDSLFEMRPRFGRTWLLKAMAAEAIRAGHLPCLITDERRFGSVGEWPKKFETFLEVLRRALAITSTNFALPPPTWTNLRILGDMKPGDPLPPKTNLDLVSPYLKDPTDPDVLAVACRLDLLKFLESAQLSTGAKFLLLIDDVHKMDLAAAGLCNSLLGPLGLRAPKIRDIVRVVLTYSSIPAAGEVTAVKAIENFIGQSNWAETKTLDRFQPTLEEPLAYEYFLLKWKDDTQDMRRPLCIDATHKEYVDSFFNTLRDEVQGVPSNLCLKAPPVIRTYLNLPAVAPRILREAKDDDELAVISKLKRK
jgi:hypothetical protein